MITPALLAIISRRRTGTLSAPDQQVADALTISTEMLSLMRARTADGPFKSAGDYDTNSPGEWDYVVARKEAFMADPDANRWAGPTGTGNIPLTGTTTDDPSWVSDYSYLLCAALYSLVADDATVRAAATTELIAQASVARLDFSDEDQWHDANGTDLNPSFETANFVAAMIAAMDWIEAGDPDAFTPTERGNLHDWLFWFGQWAMRELTTAFAKVVDVGDASTAPPWANPDATSVFRLAYDALGEDTIGTLAVYWNNRRNCLIRTCGMIGKKLDLAGHTDPGVGYGWTSAELVGAAKNLAKGWIAYSVFPEGYVGEFERIGSSGGVFYAWQTVGPLLTLAHCLAIAGDTELLEYQTEAGHETSESTGTPKSLEWITLELLKYTGQNTYARYKDAALLGLNSQTSSTKWAHDGTAAILLPHASQAALVRSGAERARAGMDGWLTPMSGYGDRPWHVAEWGVFPVLHFAFNPNAAPLPEPDPPPSGDLIGVGSTSTSLTNFPQIADTTTGDKYVDASVGSSGDGNSLATAYRTIQEGLAALSAGQTLIVKGGTYPITSQIARNTPWASATRVMAYGDEQVVIDASLVSPNTSAVRFNSSARRELWHRIKVVNVPDNAGGYDGQAVAVVGCSDVTLSRFEVTDCRQDGIWCYNAVDIDVLDSAVHGLGDGFTQDTNVPDNFAATGSSQRVNFVRCFSAFAPDDGFDFWTCVDGVFEDCVSYRAGYYRNGNPAGDGNGYKMGGNAGGGRNLVRGALAISCRSNGFDDNASSIGENQFRQLTAVGNGNAGVQAGSLSSTVVRDTIANGNSPNYQEWATPGPADSLNTWNLGITNPQFADPAAYDWSLLPGSPAIGAGTSGGNLGASEIALAIAKEWIPRVTT